VENDDATAPDSSLAASLDFAAKTDWGERVKRRSTASQLPRPHPIHAIARRLGAAGVPGARVYWPLAERLAPWPETKLVRVADGVPILVGDQQDFIGSNIYRGLYERAEVRLLPHLLRPGDLFVDVGANLGYYTAMASLLVGPTGQVHAFEPSPECFARLQHLVEAAGLENVTLRQAGVGERAGSRRLYNPDRATNSGAGTLRADLARGDTGVDVEVVRLDDVAAIASAAEIGLLKIDTEGFEEQVLEGSRRLLDAGRVRFWVIEVSPNFGSTNYAADLLERLHSYRAFVISEEGVVRRTRLEPITAERVRVAPRQFNMLLARDDAVSSVARFSNRFAEIH
jgi:FkbM family methyltransferase